MKKKKRVVIGILEAYYQFLSVLGVPTTPLSS